MKNCSRIFTRQIELNFVMRQLFGHEKVSKKFEINWAKLNGTCFTKCHLGQHRKKIIGGIFLNNAMKSFSIFYENMTQKNYENYLGILEVTEI